MTAVIWQSYNPERSARLFGDQVMLDEAFDKLGFQQYNGFEEAKDISGAIVVFPLEYNEDYTKQLNEDIARLDWVLIILTANEGGSPAYKYIHHPNMKMWIQSPRPKNSANKHLALGYPSQVAKENVEIPSQRDNDWFFAGQVNHKRREQCVEVLRKLPNGELLETAGFNQGFEYKEYLTHMANAKVVPCPGGPQTPDTFRIYEALELGCIPVLDKHFGAGFYLGDDYWTKVLGVDHPLKTVHSWQDFPKILEEELANWEERSAEVQQWWSMYKTSLLAAIEKDVFVLEEKV